MVTVVSSVPHASVVRETICGNCGSTLRYTPNDVQKEVHRDYGGGVDTEHFIQCPACGKKAYVNPYGRGIFG